MGIRPHGIKNGYNVLPSIASSTIILLKLGHFIVCVDMALQPLRRDKVAQSWNMVRLSPFLL